MRPTVVRAPLHQQPPSSSPDDMFTPIQLCLSWHDNAVCLLQVLRHFESTTNIQQHAICPPFCLCPSPALFHLPQHTEGCFLSLGLGTDLITYLFSLSYSKLLWLCVLLRTDIFLPPLLLSAFHPVSPSAPHCLTPHWLILYALCCYLFLYFYNPSSPTFSLATVSALSYNLVLHRLCHFSHYLPFSSGQIASVVCNSLQGSLLCPPPSQTPYRSVSVTQRVDLSK